MWAQYKDYTRSAVEHKYSVSGIWLEAYPNNVKCMYTHAFHHNTDFIEFYLIYLYPPIYLSACLSIHLHLSIFLYILM